jgi:glycosyltransferase involved in cell wall biosynthesis
MTVGDTGRDKKRLGIVFHESAILGAGVSITRAAELLRRAGWATSGWFPGPGPLVAESDAVLDSRSYAERPLAVSLRGWRQSPGALRRLRRTPAYLRAFKRWLERERPAVVHVNSLLMLPEATIARRLGFPIVLQVHEIPPPGLKLDLTLRWASAVADVLVGVSEAVTDMLSRGKGSPPRLTVRNGVPRAGSPPKPQEDFIVGTVGHVSRTKGTDVFLEAAELVLRRHPSVRFEHIGPLRPWGDDEFEEGVQRATKSAALRSSVSMLGDLPARDAYARWNAFVLSSRQEGFPLSTLEAMAAGVPVIATEVGGIPEQIVHLEHGILVAAEDAPAIASWIGRLHDDADLRARLATAGRARVEAEFTLEQQAQGLDRAYEEALRRRRR